MGWQPRALSPPPRHATRDTHVLQQSLNGLDLRRAVRWLAAEEQHVAAWPAEGGVSGTPWHRHSLHTGSAQQSTRDARFLPRDPFWRHTRDAGVVKLIPHAALPILRVGHVVPGWQRQRRRGNNHTKRAPSAVSPRPHPPSVWVPSHVRRRTVHTANVAHDGGKLVLGRCVVERRVRRQEPGPNTTHTRTWRCAGEHSRPCSQRACPRHHGDARCHVQAF